MIHRQIIEAIAYGDAKGLPFETRTKSEITAIGGAPRQLIRPSLYSTLSDLIDYPAGTWSDDTQHALAVAESLIRIGGYSLKDIAMSLKDELPNAVGWGNTTKVSIGRISEDMTVEDLEKNGETTGNGCGPLMRSVPLALYTALKAPGLTSQVATQSARLTHNNPENIACTVAHHKLIEYLVSSVGSNDGIDVYNLAIFIAQQSEAEIGARSELSDVLIRVRSSKDIASDVYSDSKWSVFTTWAVQAVAYGVALKRLRDPLDEVIEAVIAEGGDTDSTASIAASLWAIANPNVVLPPEVDKLHNVVRLQTASRGLLALLKT